MKKILSFLLVFALAFAIIAPAKGEAALFSSVADQYSAQAQADAAALSKQISIEYTKTIKYPNMGTYTFLKHNITVAKRELPKVKNKTERQRIEKRIAAAELVYQRTQGYIDAISSGEKLARTTADFNKYYAADPLSDQTEQAYHTLSYEINKQAKMLYRVYGKSTREAILKKYKAPAEAVKKGKVYEISTKMALDKLGEMLDADESRTAIDNQVKAIEKLLLSSKDANFVKRVKAILTEIKDMDAIFKLFVAQIDAFVAEDVDGYLKTLPAGYPGLEELETFLTEFFAAYDVALEIEEFDFEELTANKAVISIVQTTYKLDDSDFMDNRTYARQTMVKVNGVWQFGESEILSVDYLN